jgi:hypothetical protein
MRSEVDAVLAKVIEEAQAFANAYEAWLHAVKARERVIEQSDRRVRRATGGLTFEQWSKRKGRGRINSTNDSRAVAAAVRAEAEVRLAIVEARDPGPRQSSSGMRADLS